MNLLFNRSLIITASLILFWLLLIEMTGVPPYILPSPGDVAISIYNNYDVLASHASVTFIEILAGLFLGVTLGTATAIILSISTQIRHWLLPVLLVTQTLPVFAIAPLLVLWLGYDIASKIAMATIIIFFPVTVSLLDGLRSVQQDYLDLAKIMEGKPLSVFQYISIPSSLPSFASGVKVATSVAPIGAVVGEWVGSSEGLGFLMLHSNGRMQTDMMFSALLVLSIIAIFMYFIINGFMDFILSKYSFHKTL